RLPECSYKLDHTDPVPLGHQPSRPGLLPAFDQNTKRSAICFFGCKFQRRPRNRNRGTCRRTFIPTSAAMLADKLWGANGERRDDVIGDDPAEALSVLAIGTLR